MKGTSGFVWLIEIPLILTEIWNERREGKVLSGGFTARWSRQMEKINLQRVLVCAISDYHAAWQLHAEAVRRTLTFSQQFCKEAKMEMRRALVTSFAFILSAETVLLGQVGKVTSGTSKPLEMEAHEDQKYESMNRDQALSGPPLALTQVIAALKQGYPPYVIKLVNDRYVDFDITPAIEKRLRKANADNKLIEIIHKVGPTARAQKAESTPGVMKVPRAEHEAYQALNNESNPDKEIKLAADFEKQFPNSSILTLVYYWAANAYEQKGDVAKAVIYGEKSISLKEDNLPTLLLLAARIPSPQFLQEHDADKERYLDEAQRYAERALKVNSDANGLVKNANQAEEQYGRRNEALASQAHASLGMIHLQRARLLLQGVDERELATAEKEYQQAIATADQPKAEYYYRLGEAYELSGRLDEGIAAFTKASEFGLKAYAEPRVEVLKKREAESSPHSEPSVGTKRP
jgi:tetratricopeptide (TPR) repeat protein